MTRVINLRRTRYDVYIGREKNKIFHYGNPFSHLPYTLGVIQVRTKESAVYCYREWLKGTRFRDVEQERRAWILKNLEALRGKRLGCFCHPAVCHGDVLVELLEEIGK